MVKELHVLFFCLSWTFQETSTKRDIFAYQNHLNATSSISVSFIMLHKAKKLLIGTTAERTVLNALDLFPNIDIISENWY